jgi:hypothetical protein
VPKSGRVSAQRQAGVLQGNRLAASQNYRVNREGTFVVLAGRARKRRHPAPVRADRSRSGQLVTRSESGIDTIVRRVPVSYMSRVFLAVVNAVQSRRNAADEEHEDRH